MGLDSGGETPPEPAGEDARATQAPATTVANCGGFNVRLGVYLDRQLTIVGEHIPARRMVRILFC